MDVRRRPGAEWLTEQGETIRRKEALEERRRRAEDEQLRELDWRAQQNQQNFEKVMSALNAASGQMASGDRGDDEQRPR